MPSGGEDIRALLDLALPAAAGMLLGAAPAAVPRAGGAGAGFRIPAPAKTILKNGLTVLVLERRSIPLVQFQLMVKSGSTSDPAGKEGTAALVAPLLKRGARTRSASPVFAEGEFVGRTIDTAAR